MAPRSQFKAVERKIAELLGGQRVPINGRTRGSAPDIAHSWLSPEVKSYDQRPPSIHEAMAQAEASSRGAQLPVSVFHRNGDRYGQAVLMMRLSDFLDWFGGGLPQDGAE